MKVYEIFRSIDGEVNACHQGRISTFVRFAGCNLRCSYCFASLPGEIELKVITAKKRFKPLAAVKPGDSLVTLHPWSRKLVTTKVKCASIREASTVETVSAGIFKFLATPDHRVYTQRGLVRICDLKSSDKLVYSSHEVSYGKKVDRDLTFLPVKHFRLKYNDLTRSTRVFNIQCEPYPTFLLNGFWVHNCDIEEAQRVDGATDMTIDEIVEEIKELGCRKVTLTGGEPLLQKDFFDLTKRLSMERYDVSVETNGTLPLVGFGVKSWVVDFKLPSSGEYEKVNRKIFKSLRPCDFVKFVVNDKLDFEYALHEAHSLRTSGCRAQFAFSPVYDVLDPRELYSWLVEHNFFDAILNVQIHKMIGFC